MSDFDAPLRRWSEVIVRACASPWGFKISGREHVPKSGPLIAAFNHASLLDGPLVGTALAPARRPNFLVKKELFSYPLLGLFLLRNGGIPLDRATGDHSALRAALEVLASGGTVSLSPEGTRVKPGERRAPKLGVSFLASKSGACVLPVRVLGTADFPRSRPLEVRFGSPLPPPAAEGREAASSFARAVMDAIYSL